MKSNLKELTPVDITLGKLVHLSEEELALREYNEEQSEGVGLTVAELYETLGVDVDSAFSEYIELNSYHDSGLTLEDTLNEPVDNTGMYISKNWEEDIMKLSDYNKVAKLYGNKEYELAEDEYLIISDFKPMMKIRNHALEKGQVISVFGYPLKPKYSQCQNGFVEMAGNHINLGIIVVPDNVVDEGCKAVNYLIGNYNAKTDEGKREIEDMLAEAAKDSTLLSGDSKIDITEATIGLTAMATFIGLYLGIIFLISSAAVLALKELSESVDNIERYAMLRRLGADEKMIKKALFKQIGIFFLCPVILAVIHSVFGIQVCAFIIATLGIEKLLSSIVMTAGIILLIYGGYFIVTYLCSKGIIRER